METPQLNAILDRYSGAGRTALLPMLIDAQAANGYLTEEILTRISQQLGVPLSEIYGVTDFYSMLYTAPVGRRIVRICDSVPCMLAGTHEVLQAASEYLGIRPGDTTPDGKWTLELVPCLGLCDCAPAMLLDKDLYTCLTPERIVAALQGAPPDTPIENVGTPEGVEPILLKHCDVSDRHRLERYCEFGGYAGLRKALDELTPDQVADEVKDSGLLGRGGAAFPSGLKWEFGADARLKPKYVVCNADESEPGTFKDHWLLLNDPFAIIEGMTLAAYAIGAEQGYIYIRGEYPTVADRFQKAIDAACAENYLGEGILRSGTSFDIELRRGAGAYICGEETALFESIEGRRGLPRTKPPFPTTHGLFCRPTVINNVETMANIPHIVLHGGEWYRRWGTGESPGTRLFCLSGHVNRPGLYELPLGYNLKDLIYKLGGGVRDGHQLQAVVCGGAAGTFLRPQDIDVPLGFETITEVGGTLGSGAVMVFDDTVDLWKVTLNFARFFAHESCGKCFPCQMGTQRQVEILERVLDRSPQGGEANTLQELGRAMRDASICGLGQTAANPVLSALKHWELPEIK